ncbi:MAG: asparagine synthase (glutamine-hydrolyzing) [Clostridiales bacterium]|nr:asparagine synthase (glutamine-hydrolyzing) [Clostridiales bacterium]
MCGIAGVLSNNTDLSEKLGVINSMSEKLRSRGPDEDGLYIEKNVCLIHRRLTVIDPEGGRQPMTRKHGNELYTIVYNGELYNTEDIRKKLISEGFSFEGHSDTEVLLCAYICFGEECVDMLNGIFAFAVYEHKAKKLFLARDPVGVKPLFYYNEKDSFVFASEIKAIFAYDEVTPEIDEEGLCELFFMSPGRTCGCGIFKNIKELLPGECMVYENSFVIKKRYFTLRARPHNDTLAKTVEYVRFLIKDSIERQLVSDVPLCTFLSGGLDSSIITKVASDYYIEKGRGQLSTYSVNYCDNKKYFTKSLFQPNSDDDYIGIMSEFAETNHTEVVLENKMLADALYDATIARDLPMMADVDSSLLLFCREMKKKFTVGVSGECADELFGGYPWYHNKDILFEECFPWARSLDTRRAVLKKGFLPQGEEYVHQKYLDIVNHTEYLPGDTPLEKRMRQMYALNFYGFMQNLLERKDRMSMYSGFEVRVPFCDRRIVEYSFNMPWEMKALNGREKGILRVAFSDLLPYDIVWRKKSPYPKTHNPEYMRIMSRRVKELFESNSPVTHLLDKETVYSYIENSDNMKSMWYGQLMRAPQVLAFIIQLDMWFKEYNIQP